MPDPGSMEQRVEVAAGPEIVPGHHAAAKRLLEARGSIYEAFDSLGIFDHDAAIEYVQHHPSTEAMAKAGVSPGKLLGFAMGFAITAVEADRARSALAPIRPEESDG